MKIRFLPGDDLSGGLASQFVLILLALSHRRASLFDLLTCETDRFRLRLRLLGGRFLLLQEQRSFLPTFRREGLFFALLGLKSFLLP